MIKPVEFYPKQMNGPVISAAGHAFNSRFEDAAAIEAYLHGLSIDTADETELENIGRIIGYLRPLVPEGFNSENVLLIGTLPLIQDEAIGLAQAGFNIGGQLSSIVTTETNFMGLGTYRKFLKAVAVLKRYGITLKSIDYIVSGISDDYEILYEPDMKDIIVYFHESIGYKNIWILTQLFYRIATAPQVQIVAEGE